MGVQPLLEVRDLGVTFRQDGRDLKAVQNVSFALPEASVFCLVGESGCGKSLTARSILRLLPGNARENGQIIFSGQDLLAMPEPDLRKIRGRRIGMIFQEPMTSLNPVLKVGDQVAEPLRYHLGLGKTQAREEVIRLFSAVGIPSPETRIDDYPHLLSGGMRQRVMIAMALACKPSLLLADEPTTALDATIQGQIMRLVLELCQEQGMAVLLITHDLGVAAQVADRVAVMYAGRIVELAPAAGLFAQPLHPYTRGLMASAPGRHSFDLDRLPTIAGAVPSLTEMPPGCPFAPRCQDVLPRCHEAMPCGSSDGGHFVACWLHAGQGSEGVGK